MTGEFTICRLTEPIKIEGATNVVKYELYGETIVTQNNTKAGDLGILFDCESQLSPEFCRINDLYDDPLLNVTHNAKGYISAKNRRIRPITLRGVKVSAMWMPIKSIRYCFSDYSSYEQFTRIPEGSSFKAVGSTEICCKYITPETSRSLTTGAKNKQRLKSKIKDRCPSFIKHFDTSHWGKAHIKFDYPFTATITEKLHGTSLRIGHLKVKQEKSWWQKLLFWKSYPEQYKIVVGTRNTVKTYDLNNCHNNEDLYIRAAREILSYIDLQINETIYCEIVGYDNLKPIMPSHSNSKLKGNIPNEEYKKITKAYGDTTTYDYGCSVGEFKVFIYRKTISNEEVSGVWLGKNPPILYETLIENDEQLEEFKKEVKLYTDGSSKIGKHIKEGVCVRIEKEFDTEPKDGNSYGYWGSRLEIQVFKNKSFVFKVLEGIAKESDTYQDIEEIN